MQNRYILALIKSETFNETTQDADHAARREPHAEQQDHHQPTPQSHAEADQLSFAFAS
jgi:hypothetical protein